MRAAQLVDVKQRAEMIFCTAKKKSHAFEKGYAQMENTTQTFVCGAAIETYSKNVIIFLFLNLDGFLNFIHFTRTKGNNNYLHYNFSF